MKDTEIIKAFDILDKFEFFGGQRAGRELWFNKPTDIQNKDIGEFLRNLDFLRLFINRLKAENERLQMGEYRHIGKTVKNARREGIEDAFDRLRNIISLHTENHISLGLKDIDLIESEMVGDTE